MFKQSTVGIYIFPQKSMIQIWDRAQEGTTGTKTLYSCVDTYKYQLYVVAISHSMFTVPQFATR